MSDDRTVHAQSPTGSVVLVRYDRQGRWFTEFTTGDPQPRRLKTVHEAAQRAVEWEQGGGTIHLGKPGGKQFDNKVAGCRRRESR